MKVRSVEPAPAATDQNPQPAGEEGCRKIGWAFGSSRDRLCILEHLEELVVSSGPGQNRRHEQPVVNRDASYDSHTALLTVIIFVIAISVIVLRRESQ
ncbi:hypothetical protein AMELA_G00210350 [Ameiurus melas]|uniref:Uncharacterized protein n=1 Tax=Ameiurus melas TaxID=219545 RepID=A0A7J6A4E6_AMEME|nr:hypothetical protein AMELA_G00210350 [Ameiurus melas]